MEEKIIYFQEGIPGLEELKQFILVEEGGSFFQLQSVEDEDIAFVIVNAYLFDATYNPTIREEYFERLGGGATEDFVLYSMVTLGKDLASSTINLKAPLLIHVEKRLGIQVLVEENHYKMKHALMPHATERGVERC